MVEIKQNKQWEFTYLKENGDWQVSDGRRGEKMYEYIIVRLGLK